MNSEFENPASAGFFFACKLVIKKFMPFFLLNLGMY
jgi:hypothetical protein